MWDINQDAWRIWKEIKTQWRAGGVGIIGLDYSEVRRATEDLGIEYGPCNKRKIKIIERIILDSVNTSDS